MLILSHMQLLIRKILVVSSIFWRKSMANKEWLTIKNAERQPIRMKRKGGREGGGYKPF